MSNSKHIDAGSLSVPYKPRWSYELFIIEKGCTGEIITSVVKTRSKTNKELVERFDYDEQQLLFKNKK